MLSVASIAALSNTVSIETGDLRKGTAFDRVKATFSQALKLGDLPSSQLTAEYDSGANRDFLESATLTGSLVEPTAADKKGNGASDLSVTYEVSHNFKDQKTNIELDASTVIEGSKVNAKFDDTDGVTEVSAERDVSGVAAEVGWLVKAKTARVKLMQKLGDGDSLSAEINHTPDGGETTYEVSYDHSLEEGRDLSATLCGDSKTLDVDYTDTKTEDGATWTASASVPIESGGDLLDDVKLSLKRAWKW